jgi:hypothetical protein
MDAIDREQTPKTRRTLAQSQALAQARATDRATAAIKSVAPTSSQLPATTTTHQPPATLGAAPASGEHLPVIVPGRVVAPTTPIVPRASGRPALSRTFRFVAVVLCIAAVLVTALVYNVVHTSTPGGANVASAVPPPSGRGPLTASVGVIVSAPAPQSVHSTQSLAGQSQTVTTSSGATVSAKGLLSLEPCHDSVMFVPNITQWTVPPGCYANIYVPNPANYVKAASWGYCNWWVEVTHPNTPNITYGNFPRGTTPVAGAAIFFDGGEQGADPAGHWAEAVAVSPDHYWVLISEMNFAWRGAGFGKIDYRYIHVSPHVHFVYGV